MSSDILAVILYTVFSSPNLTHHEYCRKRLNQFEELRKRKDLGVKVEIGAASVSASAEDDDDAIRAAPINLPARKRRAIDVLKELAESDSGEGSDDEKDTADLVLDWRAKGV